jgi:hypothetical protein
MPNYFAVPYLNDQTVKIYDASGNVINTINLDRPGANAVVPFIYSNPSGGQHYLFVSFDEHNTAGSATSHVDIYDITNIEAPAVKSSLVLSNAACGMAVQPGTMDLYVATFSDDITDGASSTTNPGGMFAFTHASGYATSKYGTAATGNHASFVDWNSTWNAVANVCANLAFDPHGNLWMTTYDAGNTDPSHHFLICFTQVDNNAASSQHFFKLTNAAQLPVTPLPGSQSPVPGPLYPLSEPHGIAFDPLGNLWMANNTDDTPVNGTNGSGAINGSLLRIDRSWIDANLLTNTTALADLTVNGYGGAQPISSGSGVTLYSFANGRFGGLSFDGFTLHISDQSQTDPFHQVIWQLDTEGLAANTAPTAARFKSSGLATTYPGNDTIAVFNPTPARLFLSHVAGDPGHEPDTATVLWESPDIGVVNNGSLDPPPAVPPPANSSAAIGNAYNLAQDGSITANKALVYVRVANNGAAGDPGTTGTEVVKVYFAKASAGLDWPAPWDGLTFDSGNTALPYGGLIGAQSVGRIDPGNQTIFTFPWPGVPPEQLYSTPDGHFCLLARVERNSLYPFGMDYPEEVGVATVEAEASLGYNVQQNLPVAWRNIAISPNNPLDFIRRINLGVLGANHIGRSRVMRFAIETLDRHGRHAQIPGSFSLLAAGRSRDRLLEVTPEGHAHHHLGDGRFRLHDLSIRLHPHEVLPFEVEFEANGEVRDFAVRVMQYVETSRGPKLLGGQTFVVGKVRGLNAP